MAEEKHYVQGKLVSSSIPADKSAEDVAKSTFDGRKGINTKYAVKPKAGPKMTDFPLTNAGREQYILAKAAYDAEQDRLAAQRAALSKP